MFLTRRKRHSTVDYTQLFMISAWGLTIVVSSFLFLYAGYWLDGKLNTEPTFMLGLFFLAVFLSIGRFYWEVWQKKKRF